MHIVQQLIFTGSSKHPHLINEFPHCEKEILFVLLCPCHKQHHDFHEFGWKSTPKLTLLWHPWKRNDAHGHDTLKTLRENSEFLWNEKNIKLKPHARWVNTEYNWWIVHLLSCCIWIIMLLVYSVFEVWQEYRHLSKKRTSQWVLSHSLKN